MRTNAVQRVDGDILTSVGKQHPHVLAASTDLDEALAAPTVIDADEFEEALLDERWRDFCRKADQYVAETTRPAPQVQRTA